LEKIRRGKIDLYKYFIEYFVDVLNGFLENYEGWYCVNEETFINERDLTKIGDKMVSFLLEK